MMILKHMGIQFILITLLNECFVIPKLFNSHAHKSIMLHNFIIITSNI